MHTVVFEVARAMLILNCQKKANTQSKMGSGSRAPYQQEGFNSGWCKQCVLLLAPEVISSDV